jgi:hypothetical protein
MNLEDEMRDLKRADEGIAAARSRIDHQLALLQTLEQHGHDTALAEGLLAEMRQTLAAMIEYRTTIAAAIDSIMSKKL